MNTNILVCLILIGGMIMGNNNYDFSHTNTTDNNIVQSRIDSQDIMRWNAPPIENAPLEEEIVAKSDNVTSSQVLMKKQYQEDMLLEYAIPNMCLVNFATVFDIECLRKIDEDTYYCLLPSEEGGLLYLLFKRDIDGNLRVGEVDSIWYVKKEIKASYFEQLDINQSTVDDVKKIDPYGSYSTDLAPYRGMVLESESSRHFTTDGSQVLITYELNKNGSFVVTDIKIQEADSMSLYMQLLSMDKPSF